MYILFLPRVGLYVSLLPLANAQGKTSWHKVLPVVKTIYTYGFHELFLKLIITENINSKILFSFKNKLNVCHFKSIFWHSFQHGKT
jgi:hypothetical protein